MKKNISIEGPDLDIYAAIELRNAIVSLLEKGSSDIELNLEKVVTLSAPAVQVIISALKSFQGVRIEKDSLQPTLLEEFKIVGIEL